MSQDKSSEELKIDPKDLMEFYKWKVSQDDRLRDIVNDSYSTAMMENIKGMRSLVINFITISAGITGLAIPILDRSRLVVEKPLLIGGLFELLIVIVFGFYYLKSILGKENEALVIQHEKYSSYIDRGRDARNSLFSSPTKANLKKFEDEGKSILTDIGKIPERKNVPDYALDLLFGAFVAGLMLMVFSLVRV